MYKQLWLFLSLLIISHFHLIKCPTPPPPPLCAITVPKLRTQTYTVYSNTLSYVFDEFKLKSGTQCVNDPRAIVKYIVGKTNGEPIPRFMRFTMDTRTLAVYSQTNEDRGTYLIQITAYLTYKGVYFE